MDGGFDQAICLGRKKPGTAIVPLNVFEDLINFPISLFGCGEDLSQVHSTLTGVFTGKLKTLRLY